MNNEINKLIDVKKGLVWISIVTFIILMIPLISMQFTQEVNWGILDFVVMGGLLFGCGSFFIFLANRNPQQKLMIGSVLFILFLFSWAELAVGIL